MKDRLFKECSSIEEKKQILLQEMEHCLDLNCKLIGDGGKALSLVNESDIKLNEVLDKTDTALRTNSTKNYRLKILLLETIIQKQYPKIADSYSQESIIVLAKLFSYNDDRYDEELQECVHKYNDKFLKKIYKRHKNIGYIDVDFVVMNMIYDEFLAKSEQSKEQRNDKLIEIYSNMPDKKIMHIYRINQMNYIQKNEHSGLII